MTREELIEAHRTSIAEARMILDQLESGKMTTHSADGNTPWHDTTEESKDLFRRKIDRLEQVIARALASDG